MAWLLDLCPPDYRGHTVVRRHPVVLARFAHWHVDAGVHGALTALREARADLSGLVPPGAVTAAVQTARAEHDRLVQRQRELVLVEEALRGRRYSARL